MKREIRDLQQLIIDYLPNLDMDTVSVYRYIHVYIVAK